MRSIGLNEYARRFIDLGNDESPRVGHGRCRGQDVAQDSGDEPPRERLLCARHGQSEKPRSPKSFKLKKGHCQAQARGGAFSPRRPAVATQVRLTRGGTTANSQLGLVAARTGTTVSTPTHVDSLKANPSRFGVRGASATAIVTAASRACTRGHWTARPGADKMSESRPYMVRGFSASSWLPWALSHMIAWARTASRTRGAAATRASSAWAPRRRARAARSPLPRWASRTRPRWRTCRGAEHSLFVTQTGKVYACGSIGSGRLGIPATANSLARARQGHGRRGDRPSGVRGPVFPWRTSPGPRVLVGLRGRAKPGPRCRSPPR